MKILSDDQTLVVENRGRLFDVFALWGMVPVMLILMVAFASRSSALGVVGLLAIGVVVVTLGLCWPSLRLVASPSETVIRNYRSVSVFPAPDPEFRWRYGCMDAVSNDLRVPVVATVGLRPFGRVGVKRDRITEALRAIGYVVRDDREVLVRGDRIMDPT